MNIFLHLIIQSESQIESSYEKKARTIIEDCNVKFFLGTNHAKTAKEFSEEGGESLQLSEARLMEGVYYLVERPRVPVDKLLFGMQAGECYIKLINTPVVHSSFEYMYKTPEYNGYPVYDASACADTPKPSKKPRKKTVVDREQDLEKAKKIAEASALLEQRKAEILKRIEAWEMPDEQTEALREKLEMLAERQLDFIEITVKGASVTKEAMTEYAQFVGMSPTAFIKELLEYGILVREQNKYKYTFTYELFKKAREIL